MPSVVFYHLPMLDATNRRFAIHILGVAGFSHDPSAALLVGGRVVTAIESEKVTRHKHEISLFPHECIRFVLRQNGLELRDLDFIATNWDGRPASNLLYLRHVAGFLRRRCGQWNAIPLLALTASTHHRRAYGYWFGEDIPPIMPIPHHLAHLGSCYTVSPYEEAAVAIIDGSGEYACTSLYHCKERHVRKLYSMNLPVDSLGHLYLLATVHLGYRMGDEYKVMGLAAYGTHDDEIEAFFSKALQLLPGGRYRIDARCVGPYLNTGFRFPASAYGALGPPRLAGEEVTAKHMSIARAVQNRVGDAVIHVLRELHARTGCRKLCMAGGVALNCVANARVLAETDFDGVFIQPAAHDGGTSLGAAAYLAYHLLGHTRPEPMVSAYLGPGYECESIEQTLRRCGLPYIRIDEPEELAAELLAQGLVLGWFQGRAEFGPRALGNRSILADPRDAGMKNKVNRVIKEREDYRPFAPAILKEAMPRYFVGLTESPYMLIAGTVRPERRHEIPAVVHVDGTARVQSVDAGTNPRFHRLLQAFSRRTGIPVLLNTSFNVAGEPIVLSPTDAIRTYAASGLDGLVMGNCVLLKDVERLRSLGRAARV